jgi:hypothetical protein
MQVYNLLGKLNLDEKANVVSIAAHSHQSA